MKLFLAAMLLAAFCSSEAAESGSSPRVRQSISWERCPENSSTARCEQYARDKMSRRKICGRFELMRIFEKETIVWEYCGVVICGDARDYYVPKRMDLSNSYPGCCPICQRED